MRISDWSSDVCSSDLSRRKQPFAVNAVRQFAKGVGRQGKSKAHYDNDQGSKGNGDTALLRFQNKKGLAESCQRECHADADNPPVWPRQALQVFFASRIGSLGRFLCLRFVAWTSVVWGQRGSIRVDLG